MFNENIIWTIDGTIKSEKKETFNQLMKEMVTDVEKEEGTLNYEWTIDKDRESLQVYERYRDADAAMEHLPTWGKFQDRFMEVVEVKKFTVFNKLTEELKEKVADLNPVYMKPVGGFAK